MALVRHDTNLWSTEHQFGWQGGLIQIPVRMTIIRLGSGELILHSPVPISPALRDELAALGPVAFVVVPNAHGRFAEQAHRIYSSAQLLAAPTPPSRPEVAPLSRFARGSAAGRVGGPGRESPRARLSTAGGGSVPSAVADPRAHGPLLQHPALVVPDRARVLPGERHVASASVPSRIIRNIAVSDRAALRSSLEQILSWDFERIVPGHGDVVEHGGPAALRAAWQRA